MIWPSASSLTSAFTVLSLMTLLQPHLPHCCCSNTPSLFHLRAYALASLPPAKLLLADISCLGHFMWQSAQMSPPQRPILTIQYEIFFLQPLRPFLVSSWHLSLPRIVFHIWLFIICVHCRNVSSV